MATQSLKKGASRVTKTARGATKGVAQGATNEVLKQAVRGLAGVAADRAVSSASRWVSDATDRLTDYASGNGSGGLISAVTGADGDSIKGGAIKGALQGGARKLADKVKNAFGGGVSGKSDNLKITNIVEQIDIGADIHLVYDLWTRFTNFPSFMKKVENVEQVSDEKLTWKAQVFWSHRTWESTIVDQVPFERIVWRSKGDKGYVDGAVTFHELAPNLTRVVLVLEYHPQGLFERTGNIWRAQGRRVRLELKHFRRQVMVHEVLRADEIEGWHGEIRDGQVIDAEDADGTDEDRADEDTDQAELSDEDEEAGDEEADDEEPADDEMSDEEESEEDESEDEEEDVPRRQRRRPTGKAVRGGAR